MPMKQIDEQPTVPANSDRHQIVIAIGRVVLGTLGRPTDLHRMEVRWLWERYYRANVFVGTVSTGFRIAHSFFLVADSDGKILESTPRITSQY
jgi:hypothetical protein